MEIFGGFMVMMSIISLFLAVVWLVMPFVVFAIKGKQDRTLEVLEAIDKRLAVLEARTQTVVNSEVPITPSEPFTNEHTTMPDAHAAINKDPEKLPTE